MQSDSHPSNSMMQPSYPNDYSDFNKEALNGSRLGNLIGRDVHFFSEVESTNNVAFNLAVQGASEGTVVIADAQTKGKGRLGRRWQSPPGCNLYASFVLRPQLSPEFASHITLTAAVAVADVVSRYCSGNVTIKWPNDVHIRGRKVCGILTEMKTKGGEVEFLVVGIGINVNIGRTVFEELFRDSSTSINEETGKVASRFNIAVALCDSMEKWYGELMNSGFGPVKDSWLSYANITGKRMRVEFKGEIAEGDVAGIDHHGALVLKDERGYITAVTAGDATVIK